MIRTWVKWAAGALLLAAIVGAAALWGVSRLAREWSPDPETIARGSLQSMREQNRLVPFQARYVAVVTSTQTRFGLSAQKTLIMPGTVRYEVDLGRLTADDVRWSAADRTLSVTLPPVELSGPEIDLAAMREYSGGGMLMRLTETEKVLDASNRAAGSRELLNQARGPAPMKLAEQAAARAVEQSFVLPLRAAGLDAQVRVTFARGTPEQVQRSTSLRDAYEGRVR